MQNVLDLFTKRDGEFGNIIPGILMRKIKRFVSLGNYDFVFVDLGKYLIETIENHVWDEFVESEDYNQYCNSVAADYDIMKVPIDDLEVMDLIEEDTHCVLRYPNLLIGNEVRFQVWNVALGFLKANF